MIRQTKITLYKPRIIDTGEIVINNKVDKSISSTVRFLPLGEAIASRAVFVAVSESDGQAGGNTFWSQINNSKTVRDRPYISIGS